MDHYHSHLFLLSLMHLFYGSHAALLDLSRELSEFCMITYRKIWLPRDYTFLLPTEFMISFELIYLKNFEISCFDYIS